MEVNDPHADPDGPYYVTNGLIVVEMVTGQVQIGEATFEPRPAAEIPVSGDGDDPAAFEGVRIRAGDGAGGHVITTGLPFRTDDYFADTRITHPFDAVVRGQGVRAQVIVPIYGDRRLEGLLYAVNKRPAPFTDRAEAVLVRLADHAAIAIRNAQSFEREHAARAAAR